MSEEITEKGGAGESPAGMRVRLVEEQHLITTRQAAPAAEQEICCPEFADEYGKNFRLLPQGGVAPEAAVIRRIRLGREHHDRPKVPWRFCPFCGAGIGVATTVVTKTTEA